MKHLDRLLLKSFFGPFLVTFGIAWFVLVMQFLWFFLEKIAGKGLSFGLVLELIAYRSVGLLPLAIPLAALIASVMVIGGLAERFELSAFQSAGTSFRRTLQPLITVGVVLCVSSYLTADYLIPAANLKFLYRLADVQQKRPALSLEPGVFNEDLKPYAFYAAERAADGNTLTDVLLYGQQDVNGALNQITAEAGVFTPLAATKELLLTLRNGVHYQQQGGNSLAPLIRTDFKSYQMTFDLSQFDLIVNPNEEKSDHYAFLTTWQLQQAADSVNNLIQLERNSFSQKLESTLIPYKNPPAAKSFTSGEKANSPQTPPKYPPNFNALLPDRQKRLTNKVRALVRSITRQATAMTKKQKHHRDTRNRFLFEKHTKLALAVTCIIFILVGGATGVIVRRGGFGYPLLVSTGCFVSYVFILEFCKRLMKTEMLSGPVAGWIPVVGLIVIGGLLLRRAVTAV